MVSLVIYYTQVSTRLTFSHNKVIRIGVLTAKFILFLIFCFFHRLIDFHLRQSNDFRFSKVQIDFKSNNFFGPRMISIRLSIRLKSK